MSIPKGSRLLLKDNDNVLENDSVVEFDPNDSYVLSNKSGTVLYDENNFTLISNEKNKIFSSNASGLINIYDKETIIDIPVSKINSEKYQIYSTVVPSSITDIEINGPCLIINITLNKNSKKKSDEYLLQVSPCMAYPYDTIINFC